MPGRLVVAAALVLSFLVSTGAAFAAWVPVASPVPAPLQVNVRESTPERTVLEFILPGYDLADVTVDGEPCVALTLPGETGLMDRAAPELPVARRSVAVADLLPVTVRVLEMDRTTTPVGRVLPSKGHLDRSMDPATIPFEFGPVYGTDAFYPADVLAAEDPFVVRDVRGVPVEFHPLAYNPVRGELSVCRRLVVEVSRGGGPVVNPLLERPAGGDDGVFTPVYREMFVNYDRVASLLYTPVPEPGALVIIVADAWYADALPLLQWKLQAGHPATLVRVSDVGSTGTAIRDYLRACYHSPEGLTYAVLIGDVAQIPTLTGGYEGAPSDPCYAMVTPDYYPDFLVSRLSATSQVQVATQVNRIIRYERNPDTGAAAAWYQRATGIASNESGGTAYRDWQRMDFLRTDLLAYGYSPVDQVYDPGATDTQVTAAVNAGRSLVNYIGHGSTYAWTTTGFNTTDVHNLANGNRLPFIVDVACVNGDLTAGECFAEAWLRSGTADTPQGAIAMYAASTNASWVPPCDMQTHVIDLVVAGGSGYTVGGLCFSGAMRVLDMYGSGEGRKLVEQYNLFGDCSMGLRTRVPTELAVNHAGSIRTLVPSFEVDVPGVAGALAALYDQGFLYGFAYTDPTGHATITMTDPPLVAGSLTLTVTAFDRVPYVTTIPVTAIEGPFLVCTATSFDDDAAGPSSGNGDGRLDRGETIALDFSIWNMGGDPALASVATLASTSPWVTLVDSLAVLGDVAAGRTLAVEDSLLFRVGTDCPDGTIVPLTLRFTAESHEWSQELSPTAHAPVLVIAGCGLSDAAPGGDGDGLAEPGEEVQLCLRITNSGSGAAESVSASLVSGVVVWASVSGDSSGAVTLPAGTTSTLTPDFRVSVEADAPPAAIVPMTLDLAGGWGLAWSDGFDLPIGGFFDTIEHGVGSWTHAIATPGFVDQWHRSMYDNHTPGGRWAWKFGAALEGTYADRADGTLLSRSFDLSAGSTLSFWHRIDADTCAGNPAHAWDGAVVEVSVAGGPWQQISPAGGYPYVIANGASPGPFATGTPCFSGTHGWEEATFDLSAFVGTAKLRFRFGSDGSVGRDGWAVDDVRVTGGALPASSVETAGGGLVSTPAMIELGPARPNPFHPSGLIDVALPRAARVDLGLYDVGGRRIRTLASGVMPAGARSIGWDGRDDRGAPVAPGVYYCRLAVEGRVLSRALVLTR